MRTIRGLLNSSLIADFVLTLRLPYRLIWLAATRATIIIYDSQHPRALAIVDKISYNDISDAAWSKDGKNIVVSSMEGYCHYLSIDLDNLGVQVTIYF